MTKFFDLGKKVFVAAAVAAGGLTANRGIQISRTMPDTTKPEHDLKNEVKNDFSLTSSVTNTIAICYITLDYAEKIFYSGAYKKLSWAQVGGLALGTLTVIGACAYPMADFMKEETTKSAAWSTAGAVVGETVLVEVVNGAVDGSLKNAAHYLASLFGRHQNPEVTEATALIRDEQPNLRNTV
jgi:hypothetical protein